MPRDFGRSFLQVNRLLIFEEKNVVEILLEKIGELCSIGIEHYYVLLLSDQNYCVKLWVLYVELREPAVEHLDHCDVLFGSLKHLD
jgi:hypothetical protein